MKDRILSWTSFLGGRIDHGHHTTRAALALEETLEFDTAVAETVQRIGTKDSLIVVTADHSHTMSMAGYQTRGKNILGAFKLCSLTDCGWFLITLNATVPECCGLR